MLENTDKAMADLLAKLPDIVNSVNQQLPDIAKELLAYGLVSAQINIWIGVIFGVVAVLCALKWLFADGEFSAVIALVFFMISIVGITNGVSNKYKIAIAPKVYLLEKAVSYTKD